MNIPKHLSHRPRDKNGLPIPWFTVKGKDGEYTPGMASGYKVVKATKEGLCWVCGEKMGRYEIYVQSMAGVIHQFSTEPPAHLDCAVFTAEHCPFLVNSGKPIALYTTTDSYVLNREGQPVFILSPPAELKWYHSGRLATRQECIAELEVVMPQILSTAAQSKNKGEELMMKQRLARLLANRLPQESPSEQNTSPSEQSEVSD